MRFISQKQLLSIIAVLLFSFLGCVGLEVGPIPEGSSSFQKGYKDGANSGFVTAGHSQNKYTKDKKLFLNDIDYKRGWEEGFFKNVGELKTSEKTDRAVTLINYEDKVNEAELISYFSLEPHKAFAINPLDHTNYYWSYNSNSQSSANSKALKKCGSDCILFAEGDDIVWEQKLDGWEKKYIEDKQNFTKKLDCGCTTFHHAIVRKNFNYADRLIKNGVDINIGNRLGNSALSVAAYNGFFDGVKFLIDNGADINKPSIYSASPLWGAAEKGHLDIVKLLIENGADVNMTTDNGKSPLDVAKTKGHKEVIELLKKHGAK